MNKQQWGEKFTPGQLICDSARGHPRRVKQIFLSFVSEFTNASNFYPTVTIYSEITKYYVLKKLRYRPKFINIKGSEQETYKKVTKKFACRWGRRAAAYTVSVAILTFSHPRSIIFMSFKSQYATLIVINSNLGLSRIFQPRYIRDIRKTDKQQRCQRRSTAQLQRVKRQAKNVIKLT